MLHSRVSDLNADVNIGRVFCKGRSLKAFSFRSLLSLLYLESIIGFSFALDFFTLLNWMVTGQHLVLFTNQANLVQF